jgi:hypothetical protein
MSIPVALWIVIAAALAIVFVYRKIVADGTDELVHVSDPSDAVIAKQTATAQQLQQLDRIVMILAILFVVYGVVFGCLQIYQAFTSNTGNA